VSLHVGPVLVGHPLPQPAAATVPDGRLHGGRPEIGPAINVRLPEDQLERIDLYRAPGQSRAAIIRDLLDEALATRQEQGPDLRGVLARVMDIAADAREADIAAWQQANGQPVDVIMGVADASRIPPSTVTSRLWAFAAALKSALPYDAEEEGA
jgi:Arc/MetJ-type ribon-helix-helix transcriptional regulator